ncbi:hypothetical protein B0H11DRAFT_1910411 [Mycena galericulata]|nr:hypothetical protein B0H11DRAFT_1910411 [Mycena galericulata]
MSSGRSNTFPSDQVDVGQVPMVALRAQTYGGGFDSNSSCLYPPSNVDNNPNQISAIPSASPTPPAPRRAIKFKLGQLFRELFRLWSHDEAKLTAKAVLSRASERYFIFCPTRMEARGRPLQDRLKKMTRTPPPPPLIQPPRPRVKITVWRILNTFSSTSSGDVQSGVDVSLAPADLDWTIGVVWTLMYALHSYSFFPKPKPRINHGLWPHCKIILGVHCRTGGPVVEVAIGPLVAPTQFKYYLHSDGDTCIETSAISVSAGARDVGGLVILSTTLWGPVYSPYSVFALIPGGSTVQIWVSSRYRGNGGTRVGYDLWALGLLDSPLRCSLQCIGQWCPYSSTQSIGPCSALSVGIVGLLLQLLLALVALTQSIAYGTQICKVFNECLRVPRFSRSLFRRADWEQSITGVVTITMLATRRFHGMEFEPEVVNMFCLGFGILCVTILSGALIFVEQVAVQESFVSLLGLQKYFALYPTPGFFHCTKRTSEGAQQSSIGSSLLGKHCGHFKQVMSGFRDTNIPQSGTKKNVFIYVSGYGHRGYSQQVMSGFPTSPITNIPAPRTGVNPTGEAEPRKMC